MWKLTWRGLRARPGRFVATVLAVLVGTGFLSTALILRDSVAASLQANTDQGYANVAAAVQPDADRAEQNFAASPKLPTSLLPTVQKTRGVAAADGTLTAGISLLEADTAAAGPTEAGFAGQSDQAVGSRYVEPAALNPYRLASGAWPQASGEVAIDQQTASDKRLGVGSTIALGTTAGREQAKVTGIVTYGAKPSSSQNGDVVVSVADAFSWLGSNQEQFDFILTTAAPGTSTDQLVADLQRAVGSEYQVKAGEAFREEQSGGAAALASTIGTALQVFAYVALFVGIFIIYNTFNVSVAQRLREFALLRAIGAAGKQVRRAVIIESVVLGVLASALGFVAGLLLVVLLTKLAPSLITFGSGADVGLSVSPFGFVQVVISGLVVTVVSAFIPAFRAARARPIEALRDAGVDRSSSSKARFVIGAGLCAIGIGATLAGGLAGQGLLLVVGPPALFLGILFAGPFIATAFARLLAPVARLFGRTVGRIASDNAARNPRRTSTTANALVVGVFLVVFVTAAGGAIRDWGTQQISKIGGADLTVSTTGGPLPDSLVDQVKATPGVAGVAPIYLNQGRADLPAAGGSTGSTQAGGSSGRRGPGGGNGGTTPLPVAAVDFSQLGVLGVKVAKGSDQLGPDQLAVMELLADGTGLKVGDPLTVTFADGKTQQFTIGALIDLSLTVPPVVIPAQAALAHDPKAAPNSLAVQVQSGQASSVQTALDKTAANYSNVVVLAGNSIATFFRSFFDALISAVNALLAVAVVIAVFGIVNTLMLSVIERTHEIGLLRAVGMTRGQLWGAVQVEALIVSLLGVIVGTACGLFVAWTITLSLFRDQQGGGSTAFSWPLRELAVIGALGIVIGVVAALLPAARAIRMNALEAIRSE
ncbi:MAG: ABC transporter permease [Acidimicrobiales bacterium]